MPDNGQHVYSNERSYQRNPMFQIFEVLILYFGISVCIRYYSIKFTGYITLHVIQTESIEAKIIILIILHPIVVVGTPSIQSTMCTNPEENREAKTSTLYIHKTANQIFVSLCELGLRK